MGVTISLVGFWFLLCILGDSTNCQHFNTLVVMILSINNKVHQIYHVVIYNS